jgi:hypothetical protein
MLTFRRTRDYIPKVHRTSWWRPAGWTRPPATPSDSIQTLGLNNSSKRPLTPELPRTEADICSSPRVRAQHLQATTQNQARQRLSSEWSPSTAHGPTDARKVECCINCRRCACVGPNQAAICQGTVSKHVFTFALIPNVEVTDSLRLNSVTRYPLPLWNYSQLHNVRYILENIMVFFIFIFDRLHGATSQKTVPFKIQLY